MRGFLDFDCGSAVGYRKKINRALVLRGVGGHYASKMHANPRSSNLEHAQVLSSESQLEKIDFKPRLSAYLPGFPST